MSPEYMASMWKTSIIQMRSWFDNRQIHIYPSEVIPSQGFTAGVNNVYFSGYIITHGKDSRQNGGYACYNFVLPENYNGEYLNFNFYVRCWAGAEPSTIQWDLRVHRTRDNTARNNIIDDLAIEKVCLYNDRSVLFNRLLDHTLDILPNDNLSIFIYLQNITSDSALYQWGGFLKIGVSES